MAEGYERIGGWAVSTGISKPTREILRSEFLSYESGEVPDGEVEQSFKFYFLNDRLARNELIEEVLSLPPFDGLEGLVGKLRSGTLTLEEKFALTKRLYVAQINPALDVSTADHIQAGSTPQSLAPDPFIVISSYLSGERIDNYEKLKSRGNPKTEGAGILWTVPPKEYCFSTDKNHYFADGGNIQIGVSLLIDFEERKGVIRPRL